MANINKIVSVIQGVTGNYTDEYAKDIEAAIGNVFAELGERFELPFMRSSEPETISITVDQQKYEVSDNVGRMLYISSSKYGKKILEYQKRVEFDDHLETDSSDATGDPMVFTDVGKSGNKKVIILDRNPVTATTWYLHYQHEATIGNINLLPAGWAKTIHHGVLSLLAPPLEKQTKEGLRWWKAVTRDEDLMYEEGIARMLATSKSVAHHIPTPALDPVVEDRLNEVNQT